MKRVIGIAAVVLLLALGGAVYWLLSSLDAIVAREIERVGSETLGTDVSVGSVDIDLREGRGTIRRLRVANPDGFSSKTALSLDEISVRIDLASVTGSPIVLPEVSVGAPAARLEANESGQLNLDVLRRNASAGATAGSAEPGGAEGSPVPVRLRIGRLVFSEGRIEGDASSLGGREVQAPLPTVRLSDVEGTPAEVGKTVASAILRKATEAVAREGVRRAVEKEIDERLGGEVGEAAKGLLRRLQERGDE